VSGGWKCRSPPPRWGGGKANSAPPNTLAGFKGPLHGGEKRGERKRKKATEEMGEKHPRNTFLVTALCGTKLRQSLKTDYF